MIAPIVVTDAINEKLPSSNNASDPVREKATHPAMAISRFMITPILRAEDSI